MSSAHVVRRGFDSAFNHKIYDVLDDDHSSDDSDNESPETKKKDFEFSDSYGVMRFIKLILFIQIIAIMLDNTSVQYSDYFRIICRLVVTYSIEFYSRPFIDLLYLVQYFLVAIYNYLLSLKIPATPSDGNINVESRRLNINPYATNPVVKHGFTFNLDVIDPHNWHTLKNYSHYILGILFVFMSILFTIRFWEISDYSDRGEVKRWLAKYITDGWWRKGGLGVALSMMRGIIAMGCCAWFLMAVSTEFNNNSVPDGRITGAVVATGLSVIIVIWAVGYFGIRFTEAAFMRYVSQNVSYTSAIILKRAVKAKLDLGIFLICLMYMPVLYTMVKAMIVITDWNDTLAVHFRKGKNFFVPCYFMAFPPYREVRMPSDTCPVASYSSTTQAENHNGFYLDSNILPCDTYLGISFYVVTCVLFVFLILGYWYMLYCMINLVTKEFKTSKFVDVLEKLQRIRDEEIFEYKMRFPWAGRTLLALEHELYVQLMHCRTALFWSMKTLVRVIKGTSRGIARPIIWILIPFKFLADRLMVLSCFNFLTAEGRARNRMIAQERAQQQEQRPWWTMSFKRGASTKFSQSASSNKFVSVKGVSMKFAVETETSFRHNAEIDQLNEIPWTDRYSAAAKKWYNERKRRFYYELDKYLSTLSFVIWLKVKIRILLNALFAEQIEGGGSGYAALGGKHAGWRVELTLESKTRLIRRLKQHILTELRTSKGNFIAEHELLIGFMDYTIDSAGLSTWIVLYDYHRMQWFLVVFVEMTIYAMLGAAMNITTQWTFKLYAFAGVSCVFGFITYVFDPYTEELDRWLEFCGRIMVILIALGTVVCYEIRPHATNFIPRPLYAPWESFNWLMDIGVRTFGTYEIVDALMVAYFYSYLFYILYIIGFFGVVDRMVQSFQFGYHDHILDFLVEKLDERTFGMENIFTGLQLVQQWDDIIKLQRRYALLCWPDVRPAVLMSTFNKIFEVQWSSAFNLTLTNLRSSLGLSILHTVMFSADGDVAKWIMNTNPELLKVQDSQNDTPITIALKECAYFLLAYGEQNEGFLDDGTSYSDEQYSVTYPEIDDIRDDIYLNGEFQTDKVITRVLKQRDLRLLREEGFYREPFEEEAEEAKQAEFNKKLREKQSRYTKVVLDMHGDVKRNADDVKFEKLERRKKRAERAKMEKNIAEKQSIYQKRFPEDNVQEDLESGQMLAWNTIGLIIPDDNIFLDNSLLKRLVKDPNYRYNDPDEMGELDGDDGSKDSPISGKGSRKLGPSGRQTSPSSKSGRSFGAKSGKSGASGKKPAGKGGSDSSNSDEEEEEEEPEEKDEDEEEQQQHPLSSSPHDVENQMGGVVAPHKVITYRPFKTDRDLLYVVHSRRRTHFLEDAFVPFDHPELKKMVDFDKKRKKVRMGRRDSNASGSEVASSNGSSNGRSTVSGHSSASGGSGSTLFTGLLKLNSPKTDRETRWKVCKFAEILMSEEIAASCSSMKWGLADFKAFNKLASAAQGKIAQNLAMVCHLNPPEGFARISDWGKPEEQVMFDEMQDAEMSMIVKGVVSVMSVAEKVVATAATAVKTITTAPDISALRGRKKRRRSSKSLTISAAEKGEGSQASVAKPIFSDRVIQFLAEAYVTSTDYIDLEDAELSYNACISWRAIARALRRKYCSFILPSLFVAPKRVLIRYLELPRNELDCGDCVYLSDIFTHQPQLVHVDLSFNRIGSRGMTRMCKSLRENTCLVTFRVDHNNIGPGCGYDIGVFLKSCTTIKVFSLSHNRLGEIVRFPTLYSRENIVSAAHDIFVGVKANKSLEVLDVSYNHLGPVCADVIPFAVNKHLCLHTLVLSGNDLGPVKGPHLIFCLSGFPGGAKYSVAKEKFIENIKKRQTNALMGPSKDSLHDSKVEESKVENPEMASNANESAVFSDFYNQNNSAILPGVQKFDLNNSFQQGVGSPGSPKKSMGFNELSTALDTFNGGNENISKPASLTSLSLADNQIGEFGGHAIATLIERNKHMTHLDVSGNALSHTGGMLVMDQLELSYSIKPRDFMKLVLWEIEERKYTGRNAKKRKKVFTHLTSLNLSRNGLGPNVVASLMVAMGNPNCTITDLDVSNNPLGYSIQIAGQAAESAVHIRKGLADAKSLLHLDMSYTHFEPVEIVPIFGGLCNNEIILRIEMEGVKLDEPSCLQLCNVFNRCSSLVHINLKQCRMGANGGVLIANRIGTLGNRLQYIDLTENYCGQIAAIYIAEAIKMPNSTIHTLLLGSNDLGEDGGQHITKAMIGNVTLTSVDLSNNYLTAQCGAYLTDAARGLYENGKKVTDCRFRSVIASNNPDIGHKIAKLLVKALANEHIEHIELANIGGRPGMAALIANFVRDAQVAWRYADFSGNNFSRIGLNQIFWALRQNKRLRILKLGENRAGSQFCADTDTLLKHGISVPQMLRCNSVLRELDLSYNAMSSQAGVNILDALIDNHTIKKLSLRGNIIDDTVALMLPDLLRCNNILEELDLGHNRMSFSCAFAIAESLEVNRSLKVLILDYNRFGGAGSATLDVFARSIMMNFSLKVLVLDGNKLGPEWGIKLAESFARNNTLTQVSFRDNRLDSRAGNALFKAFSNCPNMIELALSADEIGNELWEQFRVLFDRKRAAVKADHYRKETVLTEHQSVLLESYALM